MNFWQQHAQLIRLGERADGAIDEADMATMQTVLAIATRSQGNRLKGRFLEDGLGL